MIAEVLKQVIQNQLKTYQQKISKSTNVWSKILKSLYPLFSTVELTNLMMIKIVRSVLFAHYNSMKINVLES